jgi:gamma-glutamylcyclotransferase (GGCT)/AIG2-like uncharacterized protein YtfP
MTRLLFFYGTLMKGDSRGAIGERHGLRLVGPGKLRGDLYSVGDSFPAAMPGDGVILGEVWEAPDDAILRGALHVTDSIEGYRESDPESSMYLREIHPLLDDEQSREVIVYRWNRGVQFGMRGLHKIESGSWAEYRKTIRGYWMPESDVDEADGYDEWAETLA